MIGQCRWDEAIDNWMDGSGVSLGYRNAAL